MNELCLGGSEECDVARSLSTDDKEQRKEPQRSAGGRPWKMGGGHWDRFRLNPAGNRKGLSF